MKSIFRFALVLILPAFARAETPAPTPPPSNPPGVNAPESAPPAPASSAPANPPPAPATTEAVENAPPEKPEQIQEKLDMSLHAYNLLQNETDQVKEELAKTTDEKNSLAAQLADAKKLADDLQATINQQNQELAVLRAAREQLRQTQDAAAQLATENAQLRTRLALATQSGSGSSSFGPPSPAPIIAPAQLSPPPSAVPAPHTYKVAAGDTLGKISKKIYGTSARWQEILNANRDKLKDDKSLRAGMELKIP
ncbi:MAG: LysM peptidoglycan-binding domain-containing protein [Verrucomicrobiota bacterium]|nr:LysM peptidoglycan-binding domain-containing protein [Verrucomicrobiota bacterium]